MESLAGHLSWFCRWLLGTSGQACVLILIILALQLLFRHRLTPRWHYCLWLLLLVRLLMPWIPPSRFSVFNLIPWTPLAAATDLTDVSATVDPFAADPLPALANTLPTISKHAWPSMEKQSALDTIIAPVYPKTTDPIIITPLDSAPPFEIASFLLTILPWFWLAGAIALTIYIGGSNFGIF